MVDDYQAKLSEQLQLLHELSYSDLDMPHKGVGVHSHKASRDHDTNRDVRILDAIAVALATGQHGDVFAAAFDKRQQIQLVLAKNGPPAPEDIAAADKLMSLIGNPDTHDSMDIFPFLIQRCGANMDKRILNLNTSLQEIRNDFKLTLETYIPTDDIQNEFPLAEVYLEKYGDAVPLFNIVLTDLVNLIIDSTAQGLNPEDIHSSKGQYANLFLYADTLSRSRFLDKLVNSRSLLEVEGRQRAARLKRRLYKVCQYVSGIQYLIEEAKRFLPIPHRWVTDTFTGTGEGVFDLCDNAHDAVSRGLKQPSLSPEIINRLDMYFPHIQSNWVAHQTVHACVHAELRILLHLSLPSPNPLVQPIGVSKRSCFCCALWIDTHNDIYRTEWMTSGSHGKPYANWAFPGSACLYAIGADGKSSVDKGVLDAVSVLLEDMLAWLFPGRKRISDEHFSSSDETSDSERKIQNQRKMKLVDRPPTVFRR
jgi:hypothetical protein